MDATAKPYHGAPGSVVRLLASVLEGADSLDGRGSGFGNPPLEEKNAKMGSVARLGMLVVALATAVLSLAPTAHAQSGASVTTATDGEKARAQDLYKSGAMSFEFKRWDDALAKFKQSYAVVRSPNTHLMVARSMIELGQKTEAFNELVATEAEARAGGERYAEAGNKAAELRANLTREVAVLTVQVTRAESGGAAATVLVGGVDLPREQWNAPRAMAAADVEIVGRYHGAEREKKSVKLVVGAPQTVTIDVGAPDAPKEEPLPPPKHARAEAPESGGSALLPLAAISAGVGAGGLTVFAVFGLMNQSTYDSLETQCQDGCSGSAVEEKAEDGKTQQTVANVGLVVGAVGIAAAATFLIIEVTSDDEATASAGVSRLGVGPAGASVAGTF